jgi:hypothetical protein
MPDGIQLECSACEAKIDGRQRWIKIVISDVAQPDYLCDNCWRYMHTCGAIGGRLVNVLQLELWSS